MRTSGTTDRSMTSLPVSLNMSDRRRYLRAVAGTLLRLSPLCRAVVAEGPRPPEHRHGAGPPRLR